MVGLAPSPLLRLRSLLLSLFMLAPVLCAAQDGQASTTTPMMPAAAATAAATAATPAPPAGEIALLLPLKSPDFQDAAEALRIGFMRARERDGNRLSVTILSTDASGEQIVLEYDAAVRAGAKVVVGPLTRSGVSAVAASNRISVPTLALNYPEAQPKMPDKLFGFGLSIELEARQIAALAWGGGMRQVLVVSAASPLARRISQAFGEGFRALGGRVLDTLEFTPASDLAQLKQMVAKSDADALFLAADVAQARQARPFMSNVLPTYATSLLYSGRNDPLENLDLNGIRFVEMPWLVQPDHPAVMAYPRLDSIAPELQRFYALGIDAYRLAAEIALRPDRKRISLDGVTGKLTLPTTGNQVEREAVATQFRNGAAMPLEGPR